MILETLNIEILKGYCTYDHYYHYLFPLLKRISMELPSLREKCPNTEFSLVRIFPYSFRIRKSTDQKKVRIWTLFTQWVICEFQQTQPRKSSVILLKGFAEFTSLRYCLLREIKRCRIRWCLAISVCHLFK